MPTITMNRPVPESTKTQTNSGPKLVGNTSNPLSGKSGIDRRINGLSPMLRFSPGTSKSGGAVRDGAIARLLKSCGRCDKLGDVFESAPPQNAPSPLLVREGSHNAISAFCVDHGSTFRNPNHDKQTHSAWWLLVTADPEQARSDTAVRAMIKQSKQSPPVTEVARSCSKFKAISRNCRANI